MSKFSKKFLKKSPFKSLVGAGIRHLASGYYGYKMLPMVAGIAGRTLVDEETAPVGKAVLGGIGAVAVGKGIQALKTPGASLLSAATSPIGTVALLHGGYKLGKHLNKKRKERKARKELEKKQEQEQDNNNNNEFQK
tara:strand:- start:154 stop:564 length:411 start_codon:yes stop_codon:yes gene_type:complete